jgi:hypothetical protein
LQKDGFEAEFEVVTDDTGKLKAMNVTSADGSPCPGPEPRKRRPKKKDAKDTASEDDDGAATSGDDKENGKEDEAGENGDKTKKPRRRRRNGAKKPSGKPSSGGEEAKKEEPSWEKGLDESVQKVMVSKNVTIDGGRAFLAIGDARVKLGTDAYAALAHSTAVLAEGKWTVVPSGVVTVTWERVLKLSGDEWVPSTVEAEKAVLLTEIKLADGTYEHGCFPLRCRIICLLVDIVSYLLYYSLLFNSFCQANRCYRNDCNSLGKRQSRPQGGPGKARLSDEKDDLECIAGCGSTPSWSWKTIWKQKRQWKTRGRHETVRCRQQKKLSASVVMICVKLKG